jgi:hypothetical protein
VDKAHGGKEMRRAAPREGVRHGPDRAGLAARHERVNPPAGTTESLARLRSQLELPLGEASTATAESDARLCGWIFWWESAQADFALCSGGFMPIENLIR